MDGNRGGSGTGRGTKGNDSFHFVALSTILVGARDGEQILVDVLKSPKKRYWWGFFRSGTGVAVPVVN